MGLFGHVVLMQVRILGLLPLVPRAVLILILRGWRLLDSQHPHLAPSNPLLLLHPRNVGTKDGMGMNSSGPWDSKRQSFEQQLELGWEKSGQWKVLGRRNFIITSQNHIER